MPVSPLLFLLLSGEKAPPRKVETPEEIAISIAAEIVAAKKGKLHLLKKGWA